MTSASLPTGRTGSIIVRKARSLGRLVTSKTRVFLRRHEYAIKAPLQVCGERMGSIIRRAATSDAGMESIDLKPIPCKFLVSLEQQQERRNTAQSQLAALGIHAEWRIPARVEDVQWDRLPRAYERKPEAGSHAMTLLSIFEEVERAKSPSFVHFEDDVVLHPRITTLLPPLKVPPAWKFIYLGGRNNGGRTAVSPGLVRSDFVSDLHAVIIRSEMIPLLRSALLDPAIDSEHTDFRIATLHARFPTYLCRPNLAWQSAHSDDAGISKPYSNYYANGTVKIGQGD
jgi:hypothetical protein